MMSLPRNKVLCSFKSLHRVARVVFAGDDAALSAVRTKINDEYKKNKSVKNQESIMEMIKFANEVEYELKTTVVQAKATKPGVYELAMTENTNRLDNVMFKEDAVIEKPRAPSKRCK